jgi:transcriptional regulator with PAS, ATPase and Fis domain
MPAALLESELFGHEKGSFTGAVLKRVGIFEEADGGTVLLDEIGELPLELQPKLLRVLENRDVRPVGASTFRPVNVRILAATHRDLRADVNAGRFRADLFFRLAVLRITLPPLRQRIDDMPLLVESLLSSLGVTGAAAAPFTSKDFVARLARFAWPGNVRELRNHLERCVVFQQALLPGAEPPPAEAGVDLEAPYPAARRAALEAFERSYLTALLARHGGKVGAAAQAAQIDRVYLYRLLTRHGLSRGR